MDINRLLAEVAAEARALGLPVSENISPQVVINRRAKTRFGCCKRLPEGGFVIELSEMTAAAGERACREVLAHELLHSCPGCLGHGRLWQSYAAIMNSARGYNIRRTLRRGELGIPEPAKYRYRLQCQSCGAIIGRMKRSPLIKRPSRYRCRCGGKLCPLPEGR